jgi:hypothetical protein
MAMFGVWCFLLTKIHEEDPNKEGKPSKSGPKNIFRKKEAKCD